jgi:hypothetical protein
VPRINWHLYKKQHDLDANKLLASNSPRYMDWEVITLFYSAMHNVDAAMCKLRQLGTAIPEPHNHKERRKLILKFFKQIASDYRMLEHISQWARYEEVMITPSIVSTARSLYSNITSHLRNFVP